MPDSHVIIHDIASLRLSSVVELSSLRAAAFTTLRPLGRDIHDVCATLGVSEHRFARPHQVHETAVLQISEEFFRLSSSTRTLLLDGVDAVIYDVRDACIGISTADCIPIVCYDPHRHCAAAIHAGWRGTRQRIVETTIRNLNQAFGSDPCDLRCIIGPGISLDSFEVGDEVYDAFAGSGFDMGSIAERRPVRLSCPVSRSSALPSSETVLRSDADALRWHIDLKKCNKLQLMLCGVEESNILVSGIDTMTDPRCFSARRDGASTGRMLTGILLR